MADAAVLFDVDGTLLDSNLQHAEAWRRVLAAHGHDAPMERVRFLIGMGGDHFVQALLGEHVEREEGDALRSERTREYLRIARERPPRTFAGVVELLEALRRRRVRTIVATAALPEEFAAAQRGAGIDLEARVDAVLTGGDVRNAKPAPDVVLRAVEKAGLPADRCIMVGDTPWDAQAARRAGVVSVGVLCGRLHDAESIRAQGAARVYADIGELRENLDDWLGLADPSAEARPPAPAA